MSTELKTKLEAIKAGCRQTIALAEKATRGDWRIWGMNVLADPVGNSNFDDAIPVCVTQMQVDGKLRAFNAHFIAHARNAAAKQAHALLTSIEALESMVFPEDYCDNDGRGCMACEKAFQTLEAIARDWEELK